MADLITVTWTDSVTVTTYRHHTAKVTPEQFGALVAEHTPSYSPADALDSAYTSCAEFRPLLAALAATEGATAEPSPDHTDDEDYDVTLMVEHDAGEYWCADCDELSADHCGECGECDCTTPDEPCEECGACGCDEECVEDDEDEDDDESDEDEESTV